ncbi:efflux RND transporter periplasmic adaptor subunit [Fibrella sp. HMF5335]|uniref:Efflux RND transporter periplasmic adaptor subunit n=1 Tax=Fibrella rubiginis TaxID=2817060 RepID=A0A939K1Y6_9BACT|nr:efflux RND transporter periplasmic adaptor subunit [Fibrella rubiginis]MBO0935739.1 efflux RND transporter periplasmic adaptor subunit [Fibrella rubiginis]
MKRWIAIGLVVLVLGGLIVYNKILKPAPGAGGGGGGGAAPAAGGAGGKGGPGGPNAGGPTAVNAYVVVPKLIANAVVATGSLVANEQVDIYPEIAGRIVQLNIREGQPVAQGSLLVKVYDGDLQAQLQKFRVVEENARRTEARNKQLLERGGISQQEYDIIVTNLKGALADIDLTKAALRRTEIRAPFSGVIGIRNVSPGAVVTPQTLITRLQQLNPMKLDFTVPERYSSSVRSGERVNFTVEGSQAGYTGQIYAIEPDVDVETRSLRIRARVANTGRDLRPGAFAKVNLTFREDKALTIPSQALLPQTRGKQVVVVRNGKATFVEVQTGIRDKNNIQITKGLTAGDTVVTTGLLFVKKDAPVKVVKINN